MDNQPINNITMQNNISAPSVGISCGTTANVSSVTFEFITTGTFTANFEVKGASGNEVWYPINAVNLGTMAMATSATSANYLYQVGTVGITAIRVNVIAVTGFLSVYGAVRG